MATLIKSSYYKDYTESRTGSLKLKLEIEIGTEVLSQYEMGKCVDKLVDNLRQAVKIEEQS